MSEIRLSKLMADRGLCSRREADKLIQKGLVRVDNNVISKLGTKVDPNATISLSPEAIRARERLVTLIVNKPPGYVSTQPEKGYLDVRSLIIPTNQYASSHQSENDVVRSKSLHTAGRLDIDSSGLVVLTQDVSTNDAPTFSGAKPAKYAAKPAEPERPKEPAPTGIVDVIITSPVNPEILYVSQLVKPIIGSAPDCTTPLTESIAPTLVNAIIFPLKVYVPT